MAWTEGNLKIFAAGLAIGGKYNHTHGTLPPVKPSIPAGVYHSVQSVQLSCEVSKATIFYSTDGGSPTTVYQGEDIVIDDTKTIFAFAVYGQSLSSMANIVFRMQFPYIGADIVIDPSTTDGMYEASVKAHADHVLHIQVHEEITDPNGIRDKGVNID